MLKSDLTDSERITYEPEAVSSLAELPHSHGLSETGPAGQIILEMKGHNSAFLAMTVKNQIEKKLKNQLQPTLLEVIDESQLHAGHQHGRPEGESHFRIRISSPAFVDLSRVQSHRLIHDCIKDELAGPIHALAIEIIKA